MRKNYLLCGLVGWCAEILFTAIGSAVHQDWRLMATTSLWMFPIYGLACFIPVLYKKIHKLNWFFRGLIYMLGIFVVEYVSGSILCFFHVCPWDYTGMPSNYKGIIRLDYAPFWFLLGLFYERFLLHANPIESVSAAKKITKQVEKKH
ncbi:MAG: hypothetical protein ACI39H_08365 [Lachnospiraceae bacterium]